MRLKTVDPYAPGLPPPGPDFLREADALGENQGKALGQLYAKALYQPGFTMGVHVKGRIMPATFVSGNYLGHDPREAYGPVKTSPVVVIGKCPGNDEVASGENFIGPASEPLYRALSELGIADVRRRYSGGYRFVEISQVGHWYLTSTCKHTLLDPASTAIAARWRANCLPLLWHELRAVKPRAILCMGSEALQALLGPKVTVTGCFGRVLRFPIPGEPDALVVGCINPGYVARKPETYPDLVATLGRFHQVSLGHVTADREQGLRHVEVWTERQLEAAVDEVLADAGSLPQPIAVDAEWHGDRPESPRAYLRTIQFSHKAKVAWCVVLRTENGRVAFRPGLDAARRQLRRLLVPTAERKVRLGGHFFRADLPWLCDFLGEDVLTGFEGAETPELTKTHGGWDTGYMAHAVQESIEGGYKLENLAARWVGVPRYDVALQQWKDGYCAERKLKDKELEGYGACPRAILHPYAMLDADATFRLFEHLNGKPGQPGALDADVYANSSRQAFWASHRAALAALEMERTGVPIDRSRGDELTRVFMTALTDQTEALRRDLQWPDFNPSSANQCRELLFGVELNGTRDPRTGKNVRLRPEGAPTFGLTPVKAAGAKGKPWEQIAEDGQEASYNPSTDKESLGILSHTPGEYGEFVRRLRNLRFLGQVLKGVLRKPYEDAKGEAVRDDDGNLVYDGGLLYWADEDGRVRTHFYPVETGRWSSSRPNLQNCSKRREDDYKQILGDAYLYPIRSMLCASPGHVLVEADFKSAEMAVIGWLADDPTMIERIERNMLPEDHPDYLDPHSLTAVAAFHLDCPPTKSGLKKIGKAGLRVAAKNVNFGVPYGRGAAAIARQCREEGVTVTVDEAQRLIDGYAESYPNVWRYLEECRRRSQDPGWICTPFGRYRRFVGTDDQKVQGEQQRQAMNFPIQSTVADAINIACGNFIDFRRTYKGSRRFRILLQIHDALLFEVPAPDAAWFVKEVLPECMTNRVDIWPCDLTGVRLSHVAKPYHLGTDGEVMRYWGVPIDPVWGRAVGVPEELLATHEE